MIYQGFSLLTANQQVVGHPQVRQIAKQHGRSPTQVIFRLAVQLGMIPLTGTSSPAHLLEDLTVFDWQLSESEVQQLSC
jgi:diketogulonate reductase-like aldo/keto reductase